MITPYCIDLPEKGNLELFILDNIIVLYDEEYDDYISYDDKNIIDTNRSPIPATRNELKKRKLWDIVINKEDYSSEEDKLEDYLRIGEEL